MTLRFLLFKFKARLPSKWKPLDAARRLSWSLSRWNWEERDTAEILMLYSGGHRHNMALVVFLRGINVGGYRSFRPSSLARDLAAYDVVNIGAAGTLVVRKPVTRTKFLAELHRRLPFEAVVAVCDARELTSLEMENPFGTELLDRDVVRFVSILSKASRGSVSLPVAFPQGDEWFVRIIGSRSRLVFGVYRRHMRTIGYLGQIDKLFGVPATTRSWGTIVSVLRILKADEQATNGTTEVLLRSSRLRRIDPN